MKPLIVITLGLLAAGCRQNTVGLPNTVYISQGGGTFSGGSACNGHNTEPVGYFNDRSNWTSGTPTGNEIGPGTTVYLCGPFTATAGTSGYLTMQGSGASDRPVTIDMDKGAILQASYWGSHGAFWGSRASYWTFNGGPACGNVGGNETACNGIIQATGNGSNLANQQTNSTCVVMGDGSNITFQNTQVQNCYVHSGSNPVDGATGNGSTVTLTLQSACAFAVGNQIYVQGITPSGYNVSGATVTACSGNSISYASTATAAYSGGGWVTDENGGSADGVTFAISSGVGQSNITIQHNVIHDAHWAIYGGAASSQMTSNVMIAYNVIYNVDHGVAWFDNNSGSGSTINGTNLIHNNIIHDWANWDDQSSQGNGQNNFHHDGIHFALDAAGSTASGISIYNNYIYGNGGYGINSWIFAENNNGSTNTNPYYFNNVLVDGGGVRHMGCGMICNADHGVFTLNNTIVGPGISQGAGMNFSGPNVTAENNVVENIETALQVQTGASVTAINNNDYFHLATATQNAWDWQTTFTGSFATWKRLCSCDSAASTGNPHLSASYTLRPGSAAIGLGMNLASLGNHTLDSDKAGAARPASGAWDDGAGRFEASR